MSYEFGVQLKQCEIVSLLTPPRTHRCNGVSEHRNRTLLDMVRYMMSLTVTPQNFGLVLFIKMLPGNKTFPFVKIYPFDTVDFYLK